MSAELKKARDYEAVNAPLVPAEERPAFHMSPNIGWMNDPNGFSLYKGEYHLFYQYYPFSTLWGPMHWGHAKTRDFIRWERLPAAMAPDQYFDREGCWSGSAVEMPDGRQLILYTGRQARMDRNIYQSQCLAVGDGMDYEKTANNPVLTDTDLPAGCSPFDFRDPKMWRERDGSYRAVAVTKTEDGGAVLLFSSPDGFSWKYESTVARNENEHGVMWECPDFFPLGGQQVLLVSPMEMKQDGLAFPEGFGQIAYIGDWRNGVYTRQQAQTVDFGPDFYAAQTTKTPDGRRVMIAWMQNWSSTRLERPEGLRLFGEMAVPRELSLREDRLIQNPVRELEKYRTGRVEHKGVRVTGETELPGVRGRILDLTADVSPAGPEGYGAFEIRAACGGKYGTVVRYEPERSVVQVDRSRCGLPVISFREFEVRRRKGAIRLRLLLDRHSLEVFVNDGEQASSLLLYTPLSADGITFAAEGGAALLDVVKYDLSV